MYKMLVLAALMATLVGCSNNRNYAQRTAEAGWYDAHTDKSEAMNVALAAGIVRCNKKGKCKPFEDVKRSDLKGSNKGIPSRLSNDPIGDGLQVGLSAAQMTGLAGGVAGFSGGFSGFMGVLGMFAGPSASNDPASETAIIAWMPKSQAATPEEAKDKMEKRIKNASKPLESIVTQGRLFQVCYKPYETTKIPNWLGVGEAWAWRRPPEGSKRGDFQSLENFYKWCNAGIGGDYKDEEYREYLMKLSADLPRWAYIYAPPSEETPYPVFYHEGDTLLFIEPLPSEMSKIN